MQEQRARPDGPDFGPVARRVQGIIPEEAGVYQSGKPGMQEQRATPDGPDFGPVAGWVQAVSPEKAGVYPSCVIFGQIGGKNGKTPVPTGGLGGGWVGNLQPHTMMQDGTTTESPPLFGSQAQGPPEP